MSGVAGKSVLVVDDEPDLREIVGDYFKLLDARVETACNGVEALAAVRRGGVDIVISDVRMPGGNGVDLLQALRADAAAAREPLFVVVSGYSDLTPERGYALGAEAIFPKPFSFSDLTTALERLLLPPVARWQDAAPGAAPTQELVVSLPSLAAAQAKAQIAIGRGGFAVAVDRRDAFRIGEPLGLRLSFEGGSELAALRGTGSIRWALHGLDGGPAFLGVEIESLDEPSRAGLLRVIDAQQPVAFIPLLGL